MEMLIGQYYREVLERGERVVKVMERFWEGTSCGHCGTGYRVPASADV